MHDVVRDVAIFIGSKEKHGFLNSQDMSSMDSSSKDSFHDCEWISTGISPENTKLSFGSDFPNLRLLMIWNSSPKGKSSQVFSDDFINFKGIEELNVLSLSSINLRSLPPTLKLLKNLRTLHLYICPVKNISVVGMLAKLEILCIQYCDNILVLPLNIRRLNHLKFLELSGCRHLQRIEFGVISSLVGLEELKIYCYGIKWEGEKNARLSELAYLPRLTSLEIYISDSNLVAQDICLPPKLERYKIYSGRSRYSSNERNISLDLPRDIIPGNWIYRLLMSTQSLHIIGDGSNNFKLAKTESLKKLRILKCSTLKNLVNEIDWTLLPVLECLELRDLEELDSIVDCTISEGFNSFQRLESLIVEKLPKLGYLWKSLNQNIFLGNLVSISITFCCSLRYLFSMATVRSLVQLQHLEIKDCFWIELLFWNEMECNIDANSIIELPKLQDMILDDLPNLAAFSQGVEIMELPQLTKLRITKCPKLITKIWKCPNLTTLDIFYFKGLHYLLSSCCMRKWNTQLQKLAIKNNDVVEEILWDEIGDDGDRHIIFPALTELGVGDLPCLTAFYKGVESIKFPKLEGMMIGNLGMLNSLLPMDSETTHDHHCVHFFCNQKVEFHGLKALTLFDLPDTISKIWCRRVPIIFFHNLETLNIDGVVGVRNLMTSSIAKNLVNLHDLYIRRCNEMVVVIEDEKEVFVTSLFPNLTCMWICDLPKLISFRNDKNAFELPSLLEVHIYDCPMMKTFTLGSVSTQNLSKFEINFKLVEKKDLNDGIHDEFVRTKMWGSNESDRREQQ